MAVERKMIRREQTSDRVLRARSLRKNASVVEEWAWSLLRKEQLGFKFRRQHAQGAYVLDFYCSEARVAVEFDGEQHDPLADARRDAYFESLGIVTYRVGNREFLHLDGRPKDDWITGLVALCEDRSGRPAFPDFSPPPHPLPKELGEGESGKELGEGEFDP